MLNNMKEIRKKLERKEAYKENKFNKNFVNKKKRYLVTIGMWWVTLQTWRTNHGFEKLTGSGCRTPFASESGAFL